MHLPSFIARRYLFSKENHNVINIISAISSIAIGIGCMALVVILSVYNGFDNIVATMYESSSPDFVIEPSSGKVISLNNSRLQQLQTDSTLLFCPVVEESVYVVYDKVQSIAKIKGVPHSFTTIEKIKAKVTQGNFELRFGDFNRAIVEESLAATLMLKPQFATALELYLPSRSSDISLVMPMESLNNEDIRPSGVISLQQPEQQNLIIVPIEFAQNLAEYDSTTVSKIELYLKGGADAKASKATLKKVERRLRKTIEAEGTLRVKNIAQQNETIYKMMRAEKFAVYMILLFIVIIISVNIYASLSLLIIDKQTDIKSYKAMGASHSTIRKCFALQGFFICLWGAVAGVALGLLLCWIQIQFGVIKLPGNFITPYYPVVIKITDIAAILLSVAAIGVIMSILPATKIRTNSSH